MEKQELIAKVAEKAGLDVEHCEKVINALYEHGEGSGESLVDILKDIKKHPADMLKEVADKTGYGEEEIQKVFESMKGELHAGFLEKLMFWKHDK